MKSRLEEETARCTVLEKTIEENTETITQLENEIQELRDSCLGKTNQITVLSEKNEGLKAELCEMRHEIGQSTKETQSLLEGIEVAKQENARLKKQLEAFETEKLKANETIKTLNKNHGQQTTILEAELTRLNGLVASANQELEALRSEYDGYKLRAQSVLRTKQSQNKESGSSGKSIAEIEEELEHTRAHESQLQEKLASCRFEMFII